MKNFIENQLIKSINKGHIPTFEEIKNVFLLKKELGLENEYKMRAIYNDMIGLAFLNPILENDFEEVFFHHPSQLYIKNSTSTNKITETISVDQYLFMNKYLSLKYHNNVTYTDPFKSFNIEINKQHYRLTIIHSSLGPNQFNQYFLRRHQKVRVDLNSYLVNEQLKEIIIPIIDDKKNCIISGSTGSGKTTFLNSLLENINKNEHLITIEDTIEILPPHNHTTSLVASGSSQTMMDYMSYALRMSPQRLIIGELRSKEIVPFLLAMNTGHRGLLGTIHANSGKDTITRMALLFELFSESQLKYETVLSLICENLDYVIFMENKKITEVIKVISSNGDQFYFDSLYSCF